jgi:nitroimidazol reductase NimA-like FMN-containing flavoprotein (pyridoxamine 5'-phosphate oxidase superfamily)
MDAIIAANRYMTLATAGADGMPWASPVWFAPDGDDLLWMSRPETRHSRNLAERPELSIVVFDSSAAPSEATALYMSATAAEDETGIEAYAAHSAAQGQPAYTLADVTGDSEFRLYRAVVHDRWQLAPGSRRVPVP